MPLSQEQFTLIKTNESKLPSKQFNHKGSPLPSLRWTRLNQNDVCAEAIEAIGVHFAVGKTHLHVFEDLTVEVLVRVFEVTRATQAKKSFTKR